MRPVIRTGWRPSRAGVMDVASAGAGEEETWTRATRWRCERGWTNRWAAGCGWSNRDTGPGRPELADLHTTTHTAGL